MALVLADRIRETTTTAGAGTITLAGATTGYQSFAAVGNGNTTYYTIAGQTTGEWEVGIGTYTASGTTLARTTILASSNAGSIVTFSAGTKDVFVTYPAGKSVNQDANGGVTIAAPTSGIPLYVSGTGSGFYSNAAGTLNHINVGRTASEARVGVAAVADDFLTGTVAGDAVFYNVSTGRGIFGSAAAYSAEVWTNNTQRIVTGSAGNVTINAPSSGPALTVGGSTDATYSGLFSGNIWISRGQFTTANQLEIVNNAAQSMAIGNYNAQQLNLITNNVNRLSIGSGGNVTIGTPTSGIALAISGQTQLNAAAIDEALQIRATSSPFLSFYQGATRMGYLQSAGANIYLVNESTGFISMNTGGNNRVLVSNTGEVTIAAPTSGTGLYVNALAGNPAIYSNGPIETNGIKGIGYLAASDTFAEGGLTIPNYGANWGNNTAISGSVPSANIAGYGGIGLFTSAARRLTIDNVGSITIAAPTSGNTFTANMVSGGNGVVVTGAGGAGATISTSQPSGTTNFWRLGQPGIVNWDIQNVGTTGEFRITNGSQTPFESSNNGNVTINSPSSGVALSLTGSSGTASILTATRGSDTFYVTSGGGGANIGTSSSSTFNLYTNNTVRAQISVAGNVTINAPTSGTSLYVTAASGGTALQAQVDTAQRVLYGTDGTRAFSIVPTTNGINLSTETSHNLVLQTAGTDRLTIASTGNVTINAPTSGPALTANGTGPAIAKIVDSSATGYSGLTFSGTGTQNYSIGVGGPSEVGLSVANKWFLYDGLAGAMRLTLNSSGNVTINAPTSGTSLTLNGNSYLLNLVTATARGGGQCTIELNDPTGLKAQLGYAASSDDLYLSNELAGQVILRTNGLSRQTISSTGNVTINAPTSGVALAVTGSATISSALGVGSSPSYGTSGQVLTSAGSAAAPTWTSVSGAPSYLTMNDPGALGVISLQPAAANFGII